MIRKPAQFLAQHQGTLLKLVLSLIIVLFIGIIFTAYLVARQANPILLDEHGKPINVGKTSPGSAGILACKAEGAGLSAAAHYLPSLAGKDACAPGDRRIM